MTMINFIDTDFQTILDASLASWETQSGTPVPAAGLLRHFFTVMGYREVMLRILANDAAAQSFLQYASEDNLDLIGDMFGVERLGTQAAQVNVRITWAAPIAVAYTIPAGTRFQTSDGLVIFTSDEATEAAAGVSLIDVACTATTGGTGGNDYPLGSVNTLLDTLSITPSSVGNVNVSAGGGDAETDERYRERIASSLDQPSTAGTVASYKYHALSYNSEIVSVDVYSPTPGMVWIFPLLRGGDIPDEPFLAGLLAYLNDDERHVICDTLAANQPTATTFTVSVRLDFYKSQAAREAETVIEAERLITEWAAVIKEKLKKDIVPEEIVKLCQDLPGVYRVRVLSPAWTQVGTGQFPSCTSIDVQVGVEYDEEA
jgi:phage-related baseplate assembly protein